MPDMKNPAPGNAPDSTSSASSTEEHEDWFHSRPYYFETHAGLLQARVIDKDCGVNVGAFEDELDLAGIKWSPESKKSV